MEKGLIMFKESYYNMYAFILENTGEEISFVKSDSAGCTRLDVPGWI